MNDDPAPPEPKYAYWQGLLRAVLLDILVPMSLSMATGILTMPLHFVAPGSRTLMGIEGGIGALVGAGAMGIGLSQWLWIWPLARRARAQGRPEFAKGMMSGAWMVFLLNASCWGIVGGMIGFYHG